MKEALIGFGAVILYLLWKEKEGQSAEILTTKEASIAEGETVDVSTTNETPTNTANDFELTQIQYVP